MTLLSRRAVLAAGLGVVLLAACGRDGDADEEAVTGSGLQVVRFFPDGIQAAGAPQRYPFGMADDAGTPMAGGPAELVATIVGASGAVVADGIVVPRHDKGLERAYWPLVTELPVGIYDVTFRAGDTVLPTASVSVQAPDDVKVVHPGAPMPTLATPTTADARGVNPVCTRDEACPLHDTSLDAALADGRPVALLVGTPAYCATGICGPVLDVLLDTRAAFPDVTYLHAEVYTDDTLKTATPTVQALGLEHEPALFLVGSDGVVRERLDVIYDETEVTAALGRLTGGVS